MLSSESSKQIFKCFPLYHQNNGIISLFLFVLFVCFFSTRLSLVCSASIFQKNFSVSDTNNNNNNNRNDSELLFFDHHHHHPHNVLFSETRNRDSDVFTFQGGSSGKSGGAVQNPSVTVGEPLLPHDNNNGHYTGKDDDDVHQSTTTTETTSTSNLPSSLTTTGKNDEVDDNNCNDHHDNDDAINWNFQSNYFTQQFQQQKQQQQQLELEKVPKYLINAVVKRAAVPSERLEQKVFGDNYESSNDWSNYLTWFNHNYDSTLDYWDSPIPSSTITLNESTKNFFQTINKQEKWTTSSGNSNKNSSQKSFGRSLSLTSPEDFWSLPEKEIILRITGAVICGAIILVTIIGNVLVIIVVVRFHRMRTVTNILLASLAIADITVASLVMTFTVVYDLFRYWPWGPVLCHFWISCDVMCCTASILHLCCVAIDRFWAITRPLRYRSLISKRRIFCCISIIWLCSVAISFIPIFSGYYHSQGHVNVFTMEYVNECGLDVNRVYATISSLTSFYLPLPIMFYVYFRILLVAERQSREIKQLEQSLRQNGFLSVNYNAPSSPSMTIHHHHHQQQQQQPQQQAQLLRPEDAEDVEQPTNSNGQTNRTSTNKQLHFSSLINVQTGEGGQFNVSNSMDHIGMMGEVAGQEVSFENKRHAERSLRRRARQLITDTKAIRTLGIVMGVFCLCWLPFFIMYVISAYCENCNISYELRSSITWLGYVNSALNPAIYAYLNKEFKMAFKRVIFCMPPGQNLDNFDRDAMLEEISGGTSRTYHHQHQQHQHRDVGESSTHKAAMDLQPPPPTTPGFVTPTPSTTVETPNWLLIHSTAQHS